MFTDLFLSRFYLFNVFKILVWRCWWWLCSRCYQSEYR